MNSERDDELDTLGTCEEDAARDKETGMEDELEDAGARYDSTGMLIEDSDLGTGTKQAMADKERTGDAGEETDADGGETNIDEE